MTLQELINKLNNFTDYRVNKNSTSNKNIEVEIFIESNEELKTIKAICLPTEEDKKDGNGIQIVV